VKKKSLFRTFGWLFLGLFVISFLFVWNNPSQSGQKVGFSEFIRQADGGKIVSVTITGNNISGQTASGGRFQTYAPNQYEGLVNQLIQKGIAVNAEEETVSPWISMLFMWGPILLIIVFWLFFSFSESFTP